LSDNFRPLRTERKLHGTPASSRRRQEIQARIHADNKSKKILLLMLEIKSEQFLKDFE